MADKPSPVIETKTQLIEAISRGCKPKSDWRIGTEHEKFTFYRDDHRPVPYEGENGIGALLDKERGNAVTDHAIFDAHARKYEREFCDDMAALGVRPFDALTRVTE